MAFAKKTSNKCLRSIRTWEYAAQRGHFGAKQVCAAERRYGGNRRNLAFDRMRPDGRQGQGNNRVAKRRQPTRGDSR
jgi:hypothetical protein